MMNKKQPNMLFILVDQLRASALPVYGETQIKTPNIDRLVAEGTTFSNAVAPCPICGPARSILLTGKLPPSTGYVSNFLTHHADEVSLADCLNTADYRTAWIGKWHLVAGERAADNFLDGQIQEDEFIPPGRDRLGFQHWRGYNFHLKYFDGYYNVDDHCEQWDGYETDALAELAVDFMEQAGEQPFSCFVAPHQPHFTHRTFAPDKYYKRLPLDLRPPNPLINADQRQSFAMYRHYCAMVLAIDDLVGQLLDYLDHSGKADNTLVVFTSDHGTEAGGHDPMPWHKMRPWDNSTRIPLITRLPGIIPANQRNDQPFSHLDWFPTLCAATSAESTPEIEGADLWDSMQGRPRGDEPDDTFMLNLVGGLNNPEDGLEWRAVRNRKHTYIHWLDGSEELYDNLRDPWQVCNDIRNPENEVILNALRKRLNTLMDQHHDAFAPGSCYAACLENRSVCHYPREINLPKYRIQ